MYRTTLGYTGGTIFGTGDKWIPSYSTPSTGTQTFPDLSQADVFNGGNRFSLIKETPTIGDNLTKVWGAQTIKVGLFYEMVNNNQGNSFVTNGLLSFSGGPAPTTPIRGGTWPTKRFRSMSTTLGGQTVA